MTDDIVARLREDFLEQIVDEQPYMVAETYKKERHEAADEIELLQNEIAAWKGRQHGTVAAMQAEIERLRAALDIIAGGNGLQMTCYSTAPMPLERYEDNYYKMMQIARAALAGGKTNDFTRKA